MKKNIMIILALLVLIFTGCGAKEEKSSLEKIKEKNKIVLGTSADYPPYEFHVVSDNKDEIVGFDIEIAKAIAEELDVELEIKDMKFEGLLPALSAGKVDFIVAGMTATEERMKSVDFSDEYYRSEQSVLIKEELNKNISSKEDLKNLKLGVQKSTIQDMIAEEEIKAENIKKLAKLQDLVMELKTGRIDALILATPVAEAYKSANEGLKTITMNFESEEGASIAIKKGEEELKQEMNKVLKKLQEEKKIDEFVLKATEMMNGEN